MGLKERIEEYVRNNLTDTIITHSFDHFFRTAVGASWFVKVLDGPKEDQDLAFIAGLLHDSVRPDTEKIDHAHASAEKARVILEKFDMEKVNLERACQAIYNHRKPVQWESPLHQSVFLSDKIFEQMGYFVAFRRCLYVGECRDFRGKPFESSVSGYFDYRINKFSRDSYPERFRNLVDFRMKPALEFDRYFKNRKPWAFSLARHCYDVGRNQTMGMEETIRSFQPDGEPAEFWKKQAIDYIECKKFSQFEEYI